MPKYTFKSKFEKKTHIPNKKQIKKNTVKFSEKEFENLKQLYNDKITKYSFLILFLIITSLIIIINYILFYFFDKKLLINFILLRPSIQSLSILTLSLFYVSVVGIRIEKYKKRLKNIH
jgi:hypothetical protein